MSSNSTRELPNISALSLSILPSLLSSLSSLQSSLSANSSPTTTTSSPPLDLLLIRPDLVSLITLLTKEVTSVGLAVKPPISSTSIVEGVLKNIDGLLAKLTFLSTGLVGRRESVGSWSKELRWALLEYTEAFSHFLSLLPSSLPPSPSPSKATRQTLLNALSRIYSLSTPEALTSISNSPIEAAKKVWKQQRELLDDVLIEIGEQVEGKALGKKKAGVKSLVGLARGLLGRLILKDFAVGDGVEESWLENTTKSVLELVESGDDMVALFDDDVDEDDADEETGEDDDVGEVEEEVTIFVEKSRELVKFFEDVGDEKAKKWVEMWKIQLARVLGELGMHDV